MKKLLLSSLLLILFTANCVDGSQSNNPDPSPEGEPAPAYFKPPVGASWHWQLSGVVNTSYDVDIYDIDLFDASVELIDRLHDDGRKVVCYFSAGSYEDWREDKDQFLDADLGTPLDGWPGERWVDVRSENIRLILKNRLQLAKEKGCDGVEPDNVDGYTNQPGFDFKAEDQLDFNRFLSRESHARGLAIGLKNDLDQVADLVDTFDFAVNEECFEYDECESLVPFINTGKPVFNAEYQQAYVNDDDVRDALCAKSVALGFSSLVLPLDLDDSFRFDCLSATP